MRRLLSCLISTSGVPLPFPLQQSLSLSDKIMRRPRFAGVVLFVVFLCSFCFEHHVRTFEPDTGSCISLPRKGQVLAMSVPSEDLLRSCSANTRFLSFSTDRKPALYSWVNLVDAVFLSTAYCFSFYFLSRSFYNKVTKHVRLRVIL